MRDEISKPSSSSSTTSWSKLKDPRIVRVSRALGGKDRHSKVCTVRGLRDRRVRLSVPTAIQLYDLQDRLGLNQPSKVVDWLLNAAKHEIDELPPLQIPQGFTFSPNLDSDKQTLNICLGENKDHVIRNDHDHENWASRNDQVENQESYISTNPSSLMNTNSSTIYNSFVRWDPSNLTLRSHGSTTTTTSQNEDLNNFSIVQVPASHQVLVYQPTQPYFPNNNSQIPEFEPKLQPNFQHVPPLSISSLNSQNKHNDQFHLGQS
ncbi:hypothetical protein BUALT_Bualt16G0022700 [Buddleja alternifolia]|uniref:TCP domain-containing protein n=1 Tax=Buddleja alternifolia TaxID=168488 RepID=A0AAV6WG52_9LAMI|nr:hypothetical protein BUALT_Bualt16G0022700 [Buddleja alternifolia]